MKNVSCSLLILVLFGCQKPNTDEVIDEKGKTQTIAPLSTTKTWDQLEISQIENVGDKNLFGKFHRDRISFHIIKNPDINLHGGMVKEMTLYFIDNALCRKKYNLDRNISSDLIGIYGSFKFKKLKILDDTIQTKAQILLKSDTGLYINTHFENYQLKWIKDSTLYFFSHEQDSISESNVFIEEIRQYRDLYSDIERDLI